MNSKLAKVVQMAASEKYDINDLKTIISALFEIRQDIHDLITDFSIPKAIQVGFGLVEYKTMLPKFQQAWLELKDLNASELREIASHVNAKFDIKDNELEQQIESGINLIPKTYEFIKESIMLMQEWNSFLKGFKPAEESLAKKVA